MIIFFNLLYTSPPKQNVRPHLLHRPTPPSGTLQLLKPSSGFTHESPTLQFLRAELLKMPNRSRQRFLKFATAVPRLVPDMHLVVACKGRAGSWLPTAQTCTPQINLPVYKNQADLCVALGEAIANSEADGGFHERPAGSDGDITSGSHDATQVNLPPSLAAARERLGGDGSAGTGTGLSSASGGGSDVGGGSSGGGRGRSRSGSDGSSSRGGGGLIGHDQHFMMDSEDDETRSLGASDSEEDEGDEDMEEDEDEDAEEGEAEGGLMEVVHDGDGDEDY